VSGFWPARPGGDEQVEALLASGSRDFAGVDFIPYPYEEPVDWDSAHRAAERLSTAGFGISIHAGEFSSVHLAPALECPGLTRIGHGTQLDAEPALLQRVVDRGIVVEVCLTSNVTLGAVESLAAHPLRRFLDEGARVVIATDNPALRHDHWR
jgi:adenosine deaminase